MQIQITRNVNLPDLVCVERFRRCPDLGPKILFFSGGTALRQTSRQLIEYTHNSIHIVTPFDSGGSSAKLREAFEMPAIGDIRNRLLALADRSLHGFPEIFDLFSYRLSKEKSTENLKQELDRMIQGKHRLISAITDPMRKIIRHNLLIFKERMPECFDLKGASIGNLILTGGYIDNHRFIDSVIYIFSKLVQVRGIVRPVINKYLHLIAELENGQTIIGQHLLTGKEVPPISSKVKRIYLSANLKTLQPETVHIRNKVRSLISEADIIIYPFGSFYSSLLANLLPKGVGKAVSSNPCSKIFIPNTAPDNEQYGMTLSEQIKCLIHYLCQDDPNRISTKDVLNFVLLDLKNGYYEWNGDEKDIAEQTGLEVINCPLISEESKPYIDENLLIPVILSLA